MTVLDIAPSADSLVHTFAAPEPTMRPACPAPLSAELVDLAALVAEQHARVLAVVPQMIDILRTRDAIDTQLGALARSTSAERTGLLGEHYDPQAMAFEVLLRLFTGPTDRVLRAFSDLIDHPGRDDELDFLISLDPEDGAR